MSPDVSLTATAPDDAVLTVTLGNATTDGTSYYATINSDPDHVFILAGTLRQAMQTPIYQMCRLPELPELTESTITSIQLQGTVGGAGGSGREQYSGPEFHCAHCHPCGG